MAKLETLWQLHNGILLVSFCSYLVRSTFLNKQSTALSMQAALVSVKSCVIVIEKCTHFV